MVELQPSKLVMRVRFPSPAPRFFISSTRSSVRFWRRFSWLRPACSPSLAAEDGRPHRLAADPVKSEANREKHDVDFVQAQELWQDPLRVEVPARTMDEPMWLVIGRMDGKHWSAVVTYRQDRIRIISVRRARDEEIRIYEV
jgi:uncharacterized DUF497 family protein